MHETVDEGNGEPDLVEVTIRRKRDRYGQSYCLVTERPVCPGDQTAGSRAPSEREAIKARKDALVSDPHKKPPRLPIHPEHIPDDLKARRQWVVWAWEWNSKNKKWGKPLKRSDGRGASHSDPQTWCSFEEARAAYQTGRFDGIGFVFAADDPFVGVDLDVCRHEDGRLLPWAQKLIDRFASYAEVGPTGTGAKIICKAGLPAGGRRRGDIEVYDRMRYFTVTGHILGVNAC